ncbi:hypothetical protein S7711_07886 [Stachybotrys chartarum IBT 7711]|uniref:Uncharacterized protein n=1 Tax=Stachybotrys chartarum (strain CBS 109288 / IBT 7711) TaxID=1280523 RepID=A0A084AK08_STACB|nr:hypothetical protein S7711_07886 [Stachybotrys chartarum IBT 7711]
MSIPKVAAEIPRISELRRMLDYDDTSLPRCKLLMEDLRAFRKKFATSQGRRGRDLINWRDETDQAGLLEMTRSYLLRDGNGSLFWPDDPTTPNYNKLQWTKSKDLLNKEKKRSQRKFNMGASRTQRGVSRENPIDLNLDEVEGRTSARPEGNMSPGTYQNVFSARDADPFSGVVDPALRLENFSAVHRENETSMAGSTSELPSASHNTLNAIQTRLEPISVTSDEPDSRPGVDSEDNDEPPTKRRKARHPPTRIVTLRTKKANQTGRKTRNVASVPTWSSSRVRRPRQDPSWATEEQLRHLDSSSSARSSPGQLDAALESPASEDPAPERTMPQTAMLEAAATQALATAQATATIMEYQVPTVEECFPCDEGSFTRSMSGILDTIEGSRPGSPAGNTPDASMNMNTGPASQAAPPNRNSARVDPSSSARPVSREADLNGSLEPSAAASSTSATPVALTSDMTFTPLPMTQGLSEQLLAPPRGSTTPAVTMVPSTRSPVSGSVSPRGSTTPTAAIVPRMRSPVLGGVSPRGSTTPTAAIAPRTMSPVLGSASPRGRITPATTTRSSTTSLMSAVALQRDADAHALTATMPTALSEEGHPQLAEAISPVDATNTHFQITSPPPQAKVAKPKINFTYYIVLSRVPVYDALHWTPSKRFTEMSLADFEHEIPHGLPADAKGWLFTLSGPGVKIRAKVHRGNDEEYIIMKSIFDQELREAIPQNKDKAHLVFRFQFECFREELIQATGVGEAYEDELNY